MRITLRTITIPLITASIFLGLQGGMYLFNNRFQEIGLSIVSGFYTLFVIRNLYLHFEVNQYTSKAFISINIKRFFWWTLPVFIAGYFATVPPYIYYLNTGSEIIPSVLASRHFGFVVIIPVLAELWRLGFSRRLMANIVDIVLFALSINYIINLNILDLPQMYFSQDHYLKNLVVYDEWRGYRLKGPTYSVVILGLISIYRVYNFIASKLVDAEFSKLEIIKGVAGLVISIYILNIIKTRFLMMTCIISIILYILFISRRLTTLLLVILLPIVISICSIAVNEYTKGMDSKMKDDASYQIRKDSFETAKKVYGDYYLFGFGQASYYSIPYSRYFGKYFAPSDLGLVGICFKYGTVGVGIYLAVVALTIYYLVTTIWLQKETFYTGDPILWGFTVFHIAVNIALILQPAYVYAAGICTLSLALGYASGVRRLCFLKIKSIC